MDKKGLVFVSDVFAFKKVFLKNNRKMPDFEKGSLISQWIKLCKTSRPIFIDRPETVPLVIIQNYTCKCKYISTLWMV